MEITVAPLAREARRRAYTSAKTNAAPNASTPAVETNACRQAFTTVNRIPKTMSKKVRIQPFTSPPDPLVRVELKVQATNVPVR